MRSRHQSNAVRSINSLAGLGQDFFEFDDFGSDTVTATVPSTSSPTEGSGESWFQTITRAAEKIIPVIAATEAQKDLNAINLERARRGLPPLSSSYIASTAPQVRVGMAPDTQRMIMWGGLALLTILGIGMFTRRR